MNIDDIEVLARTSEVLLAAHRVQRSLLAVRGAAAYEPTKKIAYDIAMSICALHTHPDERVSTGAGFAVLRMGERFEIAVLVTAVTGDERFTNMAIMSQRAKDNATERATPKGQQSCLRTRKASGDMSLFDPTQITVDLSPYALQHPEFYALRPVMWRGGQVLEVELCLIDATDEPIDEAGCNCDEGRSCNNPRCVMGVP